MFLLAAVNTLAQFMYFEFSADHLRYLNTATKRVVLCNMLTSLRRFPPEFGGGDDTNGGQAEADKI